MAICRAGRLLLVPDERAAEVFAALLADRRIPHAKAAEALALDGYRVSEQVIRRHRLRLCCCFAPGGIALAPMPVRPAERPAIGAPTTEVPRHA
jgi:hypothetical protein